MTPTLILRPGPASSVWPNTNAGVGVVLHSSEGYEAGMWERLGSGQVSWHFSVMQDGRIYQHYPLTASCWHAGNHFENARLVGIELEGVIGEPLTASQLQRSVELVHLVARQKGFVPTRARLGRTLWEHNEVVLLATPNAGPTSCPNGRIPWEEYEMPLTAPVLNADAVAFLQKFVASEPDIVARNNGGAIDAIVGEPRKFIVTLPNGA